MPIFPFYPNLDSDFGVVWDNEKRMRISIRDMREFGIKNKFNEKCKVRGRDWDE
jgi:hypothetical protein